MNHLKKTRHILLTLLFLSAFSSALESTYLVKANAQNINLQYTDSSLLSALHKIGEGKMKVLFWKVYKAEFYAKNKDDLTNSTHKALKLTYQRNIEKKEFIDATEDQWKKLNHQLPTRIIPIEKEKEWLNKLNVIFPNIIENDIILFILDEQNNANFYLKRFDTNNKNNNENYQLIGSITDPLFGDYFLSIWLSQYTSEPKLRQKLLGQ